MGLLITSGPRRKWSGRQQRERLLLQLDHGAVNRAQRTVSSHLYRIFPKLGISARGQIAVRLAGASPDTEMLRAVSAP